jgi:Flp pilus assembly protein TadB
MNLNYLIYGSVIITLILFILRKYVLSKNSLLEQNVIESLKQISESMKTGNSFESAINQMSTRTSEPSSHYFKKILKLSQQGMSIDQALIETAKRSRNQTLSYISEVIALTITSKGNIINSLDKLSNKLWEIEHLQKKIDEKASSALTILHVVAILIMPAIFYFLAGILSTDDLIIGVDLPMKIYLGLIMLLFSFMEYFIFKDFKECLFTLPLGISIYFTHIIILGPIITNLFNII